MHELKIQMTLETSVNDALDLFRHHERDKYLFDSIRGHLEEISIFPDKKHPAFMNFPDKPPVTLEEFVYVPRLLDNDLPELDDRPAWQYEAHLKFLRIAKIKSLTPLVRVQCLNLFMRFYAFLFTYVGRFSYSVGSEDCLYVVEYLELLSRQIEKEAETEYEIPLEQTHLTVNFIAQIRKGIERNARETWARSKGFKNYKSYHIDYMERLKKSIEESSEYRSANPSQ